MKKHILGLMLIGFLAMFSCNKDTELYSDDSIADLILETRGLTNDCFQFVYPVEFQLNDSSIEVGSEEELQALKQEFHGKLRLVFPVDVINSAGEAVVVEDPEQMHLILEECGIVRPPDHNGKPNLGFGPKHGKGGPGGPGGWTFQEVPKCFEIVFPLTVIFPDESTAEVADKTALHDAWKAWKEANPGVKGGPEFDFPIQVIKNGETEPITISSKEELKALRKSC